MKIKFCHSDYLYMVSATRYLKIRCWHSRYRRAEMTALWEMMMGEPARDMSAVTISGTVSAVSAFWIPAGKLILLCQVDSDQVKQKVVTSDHGTMWADLSRTLTPMLQCGWEILHRYIDSLEQQFFLYLGTNYSFLFNNKNILLSGIHWVNWFAVYVYIEE